MPLPHPDAIADCVLNAFNALPSKCKPRRLADGRREWVPLAGIVLSRDHAASSLTCAALATGMKCLPQSKLPLVKGNVLHDWHAEVLAIRAFNRWLVDECAELVSKGLQNEGTWLRRRKDSKKHSSISHGKDKDTSVEEESSNWQAQPFAIQDDVRIHMYCSEAPCGDASMELTMAEQGDATPWTQPPAEDGMLGRGNFDQLGVVRRKPARPDAPPTLSKSCSDKLAMKQCTSLLSGLTSLLVHPRNAYLSTLVLPESQLVPVAVERAFGATGRMQALATEKVRTNWQTTGYAFTPFEVTSTTTTFEYSKRGAACADMAPTPSNLSTLWTPTRQEVLINGVLQGRKQLDPKGASCVSRKSMWQAVINVETAAIPPLSASNLTTRSYAELKSCEALLGRETVKAETKELALKGWKRNVGDEEWELG